MSLISVYNNNKMQGKLDLLAIWGLSFTTFVTMNNIVGFFAILASITSIIRNLPFLKKSLQDFVRSLKN